MRAVVLDFETASACDLKAAGAWRYAEDPTTDVLCASVTVKPIGDRFLWTPNHEQSTTRLRELALDPETIFIAHSAGFEKAHWRKIMVPVFGMPDIPNSRWHDTQAMCAYRRLPLDLDKVASVLNLPYQKDKEGKKITLAMSKPNKDGYYDRSADKLERVYSYCMSDSDTENALVDELGYLPEGERDVWLLDQKINERGVRIDLRFVEKCQMIVNKAQAPLLAEFKQLTGLKPGQIDKVQDWVVKQGYWLPNLKKETLARIQNTLEGEEATNDLDQNLPDLPPVPPNVAAAMRIRSRLGSASIKKLKRMAQCAGLDGRARGLLQYHAAGPGRWGGRLLQPQNFPRGTGKHDPEIAIAAIMTGDYEYVQALLGDPTEVVANSLRHALVPNKGRLFTAGDFAGIEMRVVLALAGQHDKTALLASGADVYADMACDIFQMPKFDVTNKELVDLFKKIHIAERTIGKNTVLGCGFQMGPDTFRRRYCPERSIEFAEAVVKAYRETWAPKVKFVWYGLEAAALDTVLTGEPHEAYGVEFSIDGRWLVALLPSGRKLWYFNPTPRRKTMRWSTPEKPDVRMAWTFQTQKMGHWVTVDAYGGILTENVVQALARDLLVHAMFSCERENMPVVLTVHDEIVVETLAKDAKFDTLKQIMEDSPPWARHLQIPVATEGWVGERYRK